ncbi:MAG TPA: tail fiber domain-containing protein [Rhizobacter sp.]
MARFFAELTAGTPGANDLFQFERAADNLPRKVTLSSLAGSIALNVSGYIDRYPAQGTIPSGADLNTYTTPGIYHQDNNAYAAAGSNYPITHAGMLTVYSAQLMIYQTYQHYQDGRRWHRSYYNGAWSVWRQVFGTGHSRLQADFSNSTNSQRTLFQTSTANANTVLGAIPNGTATISALNLYANSDADNAPILQIRADPTQAVFLLNKTGTATAQTKFSFQDSIGAEKVGIDNTGLMAFGTTGQIKFGNAIRQHITLWETSTTPGNESSYGLGVQNSSWYARSDAGFAFFQKGTHHADKFNPGSNGKMLVQFDADSNGNACVGVGGAHGGVSTAVQVHRGAIGTQQGHYALAQGGSRLWQLGIDTDRSFRVWSYSDAGAYSANPLTLYRDGSSMALNNAGLYLYTGWFRSQNWNTGWYHELGGGGWYMSDTTWIRNYNNKPLLLQCSGGTVARFESPSPTMEWYDTDHGTTSWIHNNDGLHGFLQYNTFAWGCYRDTGNSWIVAGNIAAYASDARLKKNPTLVRESVLDRFFDGIVIREFDWDMEAIERLNPGFVPNATHEVGAYAQEVETVFKSMVHTRDSLILDGGEHEGIKTLRWEKAVPFTIAGLQRVRGDTKQLKYDVADLLRRVEKLEAAA